MAATSYAALLSLMQTIDHVIEHGRDSFSIDHEQIQSIQERAAFLVEFLESYSHGDNKEIKDLQAQIANVYHEAEDLIESKVVDYILDNSSIIFDQQLQKVIRVIGTFTVGKSSTWFRQQLEKMIDVMDLMQNKAKRIKEKGEVEVELPKDSTVVAASSSSSASLQAAGKDTMVGFEDVLNQIMGRLTRQESGPRQIITISGMGGIGKTTLARNLCETPYIVQHFDVRAWVTISQEYEIKDLLSNLLIEFNVPTEGMDESQLGVKIHKYLFRRRYLIVMDDMWSIDVWDRIQRFLPDNRNGSGIVITTRWSDMASQLGSCDLKMNFLDERKSWELFCVKVFGQQDCPPGLEEIGREISKNCKGLPLSIVVIAGFLAKSNMTREYWNYVATEVKSIVIQSEDGQCSKILSLSYTNLPVHLKPCLLYMGVYPEDHEIKVSELMKLWVSEGFIKPNKTKTLEEVGEEYLTDLIDRNLIMVHCLSSRGKMKRCKIHDLLGDLCLREAQIENFICVTREKDLYSLQALHNQRRIVVDKSKKQQRDSVQFNNQLVPLQLFLPRSVTFNSGMNSSLHGCKLMRVLSGDEEYEFHQIASNQVNLRYLIYYPSRKFPMFPSSINLLWNLQTIIVEGSHNPFKGPDIWKMKQLRHFSVKGIKVSVDLPEPPPLIAAAIDGDQEDTILEHLQTLKVICNLTFSEGIVKRIPNIKKLKVIYDNYFEDLEKGKDYCLSNLQYLLKLKSLHIDFGRELLLSSLNLLGNLIFPPSLKKLYLAKTCIPWEDMSMITGCLPNLEVLRLGWNAFIGEEWNPIEGQFISLKYLQITDCKELKVWNAESIHFPVLELLILDGMRKLEEIPQGVGEIPTLRLIQLDNCSDSVVSSAIDLLNEQESQGNLDIKLEVWLWKHETQLTNLEIRDNFIVHYNNLKVVLHVALDCEKCKIQVLKSMAKLAGVQEISVDAEKGMLTVIGDVDPVCVVTNVRKTGIYAEIISVGPQKKPDNDPPTRRSNEPLSH